MSHPEHWGGLCLYKLQTNKGFSQTKKLILLK